MMKFLEYLSHNERLKEVRLFRVEKRRLRKVKRRQSQDLFSGAQWHDKRQRAQTETRSLRLNTGKHVFSVRVTEHWYSLSREAEMFPSSEIFRSSLVMVLGSGWSLLSRGDGQDNLQGSLPNPVTPWFCELQNGKLVSKDYYLQCLSEQWVSWTISFSALPLSNIKPVDNWAFIHSETQTTS